MSEGFAGLPPHLQSGNVIPGDFGKPHNFQGTDNGSVDPLDYPQEGYGLKNVQLPDPKDYAAPKDVYLSLTNQTDGETLLTVSTPLRQLLCVSLNEMELLSFHETITVAITRLVRSHLAGK